MNRAPTKKNQNIYTQHPTIINKGSKEVLQDTSHTYLPHNVKEQHVTQKNGDGY